MNRILRNIMLFAAGAIACLSLHAQEPVGFQLPKAWTFTPACDLRSQPPSAQHSEALAGAFSPKKVVEKVVQEAIVDQGIVPDMLSYAKSFIGSRYRRGAKGPKTFDCSGFTSYVYKQFGYKLGASSGDQYRLGTSVHRDELQPGDLIFFSGRAAGKTVGHVGIVVEADPVTQAVKFIHASTSRGVRIDDLQSEPYWNRRYIGAKRVLSEADQGLF
ncbi:MAG: C40 family peptidase [Bacteroidales bacterium]|nr:C40 family peptidase [Bacteroidales bacterium]MCD8395074.1 C40 family peptidase [Bacteroidales bacterium]